MKTTRNLITVVISCISLLTLYQHIYSKGAGSTAAQFLMVYPTARASGMGGAYVGDIESSDSVYWNPAGLGYLARTEISVSHIIYLEGLNYNFISYAEPMRKAGTFSIGGIALYSGSIPQTKEDSLGRYVETEQKFNTVEAAILVGWGKQFSKRFAAGLCAKFINQQIAQMNTSGFAGDFGIKYIPSDIIKTGFVIQNIGPEIKGNTLPTNIKAGISLTPLGKMLNFNLDLNQPLAGKMSFAIGFERWVGQIFAFRMGYNSAVETGGLSGLQAGIGTKWRGLTFDYAFIPYGDIGFSHIFSLGFIF